MNHSRCCSFPRWFQNTRKAKSRAKVAIDDQRPRITSQNPSTWVPFPPQRKLNYSADPLQPSPRSSRVGSRPSPARATWAPEGDPSLEANPAPALPPSPAGRAAPASAAQPTSLLPGLAPHCSALLRTAAPQPSLRTGCPASPPTYLSHATTLPPKLESHLRSGARG